METVQELIDSGNFAPDGLIGTYRTLKPLLGISEKQLKKQLDNLGEKILVTPKGIFVNPRPKIRWCSLCKLYKDLEDFGKSAGKKSGGHQAYCQPCAKLNSQLRWHNMSKTQYDLMLFEQEGRCAICDEVMDVPQIDHDHSCCPNGRSCGRCTRALLCVSCNFTLGWSRDDTARLRAAAVYIEQHRQVMQLCLGFYRKTRLFDSRTASKDYRYSTPMPRRGVT